MNEDEGWKVVGRKRHGKAWKSVDSKPPSAVLYSDKEVILQLFSKRVDNFRREDVAMAKLVRKTAGLMKQFDLDSLVCLGMGRICQWGSWSSFDQLAYLLLCVEEVGDVSVTIVDPVFTDLDMELLEGVNPNFKIVRDVPFISEAVKNPAELTANDLAFLKLYIGRKSFVFGPHLPRLLVRAIIESEEPPSGLLVNIDPGTASSQFLFCELSGLPSSISDAFHMLHFLTPHPETLLM